MEKYFDKNIEYDIYLEEMSDEFLDRWNNDIPSPQSSLDNFAIIRVVGSGAFGTVKLCRDKRTKQYYAFKFLRKEYLIKKKQAKNVCNERRIMKSINFSFVMTLSFSLKDNDYVYLAMPFLSGGELYAFLRRSRKFNEEQASFYASQVFLALEYLHNLKLIYRDLKPENLLIDAEGYLKLTDFGFTKKVEDRTFTFCGTPEYLAPEIIQSKSYGTSVDWWAFGVLLFEFVTGSSPFSKDNDNVMTMYSKICEGNYKIPTFLSAQLTHLIQNLLQVDLSRRLGNLINGNKQIKKHDWFNNIDWFDILNRKVEPVYVPRPKSFEDSSSFRKTSQLFDYDRSSVNQFQNEFFDF